MVIDKTQIKKRPLVKQIFSELLYGIRFFTIDQVIGIFYNFPVPLDNYTKRPVVLVPGMFGKTFTFYRLRKKLMKEGYPVYTVSLGLQLGDVIQKSEKVSKYLEDNNINDCYILGHSSGGIISFLLLASGNKRVRRLIAFGSPFFGSYLAYLFPYIKQALQVKPGSIFLNKLKSHYNLINNATSVYSKFDQITIPTRKSRLYKSDDIFFPEIGHLNPIMSSTGVKFIQNLLNYYDLHE